MAKIDIVYEAITFNMDKVGDLYQTVNNNLYVFIPGTDKVFYYFRGSFRSLLPPLTPWEDLI